MNKEIINFFYSKEIIKLGCIKLPRSCSYGTHISFPHNIFGSYHICALVGPNSLDLLLLLEIVPFQTGSQYVTFLLIPTIPFSPTSITAPLISYLYIYIYIFIYVYIYTHTLVLNTVSFSHQKINKIYYFFLWPTRSFCLLGHSLLIKCMKFRKYPYPFTSLPQLSGLKIVFYKLNLYI